jgi:hypothetical protein
METKENMETKEESSLLRLLKASKSINKQERSPEKLNKKSWPRVRDMWYRYIKHRLDRSPNIKEYQGEFPFLRRTNHLGELKSDYTIVGFKRLADECRKKKDKTAFIKLQKFYREVLQILYDQPEFKNKYPKYWFEFVSWCQHVLSYDFESFLQIKEVTSPRAAPNVLIVHVPIFIGPPPLGIHLSQQSDVKKEESLGEEEKVKHIKVKLENC